MDGWAWSSWLIAGVSHEVAHPVRRHAAKRVRMPSNDRVAMRLSWLPGESRAERGGWSYGVGADSATLSGQRKPKF